MNKYGDRFLVAFRSRSQVLNRKLSSDEISEEAEKLTQIILGEARREWGVKDKVPVPRKRNELLDALVALCGGDPEHTTKSEFKTAANALAEIKTVCPELTKEILADRCATYRQKNRDWQLTPPALAKWWSHLGGGPRTQSERSDIYMEPPGWRSVLKHMYDLSDAGVRDKQWLDISPDTRRQVIQRMKNA